MMPGQRYKGPRPVGGKGRKVKAPAVPSETHVGYWRKLARKARAVADDPLSDALGLVQAADKAKAAVAPLGHRDADSVFIKLVRLGQRFLLLSGVERQAQAASLGEWADAVIETLDTLGRPEGAATKRHPYAGD